MDSFSVGLAIGIGVGFGGGFGGGLAAGITNERQKLEKQLRTAIRDNEVSILDKNGEPLAVEVLFAMLNKNYKKV